MKRFESAFAADLRRGRLSLAQAGMDVTAIQVDLPGLAHKEAEFTAINPLKRAARSFSRKEPRLPNPLQSAVSAKTASQRTAA